MSVPGGRSGRPRAPFPRGQSLGGPHVNPFQRGYSQSRNHPYASPYAPRGPLPHYSMPHGLRMSYEGSGSSSVSPFHVEGTESPVPVNATLSLGPNPVTAPKHSQEALKSRLKNCKDFADDCIVITDQEQSLHDYACMVEQAVRERGFRTNIAFPQSCGKNEMIPILRNRGVLFAIFIRTENVERQSVTVHVIKPTKTEVHKNMPLAKACELIRTKFDGMKYEKVGGVPPTVKTLLKNLEEDTYISNEEYSMLINFLKLRRRKELDFEIRSPSVDPSESIDALLKDADVRKLQMKIKNWLSEESSKLQQLGQETYQEFSDQSSSTDTMQREFNAASIFSNPDVNKALNSLMKSSILPVSTHSALRSQSVGQP